MAKIISGGLIGSSAPQNIQSQAPMQESAEESWGQWGMRNAVKALPDVWAGAKSGFGLGDIEHTLRTELGGDPEEWPNYVLGFPTFQEARQGNRAIFPEGWKEYGTETKPGDWFPEFLTGTGLPMALSGGLSSGPALMKTLGMLGGGEIGGGLGEKFLGELGYPKTGRALGTLAGGHYGIKGTQAAVSGASRTLGPKVDVLQAKNIEQAMAERRQQFVSDKQAFEEQKAANLKDLAKQYNDAKEQQLKALEEQSNQRKLRFDEDLQLLESQKATHLDELHKNYPPKVQQLIEEEKKLKAAIPLEYDAFNKWKKNRIENIDERTVAYDKEIQTLNKIMAKNAEKHESFAGKEISKKNGKSLEKVINKARENLELLTDSDQKRFTNFLDSIQGKVQTTGLTLDNAKSWYKKANSMIFGSSTADEMKTALHDVMTPKGGLRDYIKETGSPEHTEAWTTFNDAYSRQKKLEETRPAFLAEQTAEKAAIRAEKLEEYPKYTAKEQAKEAKNKRESLEKEYANTLEDNINKVEKSKRDLAKEYNDALEKIASESKEKGSILEREHKSAIKIIGESTYEDLLNSKNKQDALEKKFVEAIDQLQEKINKPDSFGEFKQNWGAAGLGAALGYAFGYGHIGGVLGGLAGKIGKYGLNEYSYAKRVFAVHPELKNEYYKLIKDSTRLKTPAIVSRLIGLGNKTEKYADELTEETPKRSKIISGGMI